MLQANHYFGIKFINKRHIINIFLNQELLLPYSNILLWIYDFKLTFCQTEKDPYIEIRMFDMQLKQYSE